MPKNPILWNFCVASLSLICEWWNWGDFVAVDDSFSHLVGFVGFIKRERTQEGTKVTREAPGGRVRDIL
ncbi:hypothetical protein FKM82_029246 [Ascaphus truei]